MKRRILAMLLAIVLLLGNVPVQAFADDGSGDMPCTTVGCEYLLGHEGNCSNYVEPCSNANCTYAAGHVGNCSDYVEPCGNINCTYPAGHDGNCSDFVACEIAGCDFAAGHEGNCSNYVEPTADELAAQSVIDLIAAIGQITLESEAAIGAADTAYAALTDAQKLLVTNTEALEAAKAAYTQLSAIPAPVAEAAVVIETGHKAEYMPDQYLEKIELKGVSGTASGSGYSWEVELAEDTDMTQPITFALTSAIFNSGLKAERYFWVNGVRSEKSVADEDPGEITVLPDWAKGRATVVACLGTDTKDNIARYTIELSVKGKAEEDFNTVKLDEVKSKKYFATKVTLSGADATAFTVSDTDFSGSTSGHKATIEYTLDQMPTAPVQLTFTMATSGSFFVSCNGGDRVEADGSYTAQVDLSKGTAYTFITYNTASNSTVRATYTIKFSVAGADLNTAPSLKDSAVMGEEKAFTSGQVYTLNLASLFKDAELDDLSYTVQIDDAEPVSAAADFSLLLDKAGDYTLVFRASDGKLTSEDCYTAKLKVTDNTAPYLTGETASSETVEQYAKFTLDLTKLFADAEGNALTYTVRVNGGSAQTAAANYSYTANEEGKVELVFQARDHELSSPEYTLTLTVKYAPKTEISTTCVGGANGDTWVKTFTVIGGEIESYEWNVAAGHTESDAHILNVRLKNSTADDAVLQLSYTPGYVNSGFAGIVSGPSSVTLAEGEATVTVTTSGWLNNGTARTYILNFTNKQNSAPVAAQPTASAEVDTGSDFNIDLSKVFSDPDGDALTYTVTANGETLAVDSEFTQTMGISGEYTFTFTATDVWNESATHAVTVIVSQSSTKFDAIVKVPEGIIPDFYITNGFDDEGVDVCGDALSAAAGTAENGFVPYTVQIPENVNRISFRGKDAEDSAWGGMSAEVAKDMEPITVVKVLGVIPSKVNNVYATAEQALFQLKDKDGYYVTSGSTATDGYGIVNYRFLAVAFGTDDLALSYTAYVVPRGGAESQYVTTIGGNKTFSKEQSQQITQLGMTLKSSFTVTAPKGATVRAFQWQRYYKADEIPVSDTVENPDGTVDWMFVKGNASYMTYRASMEGKLTKVGYVNGDAVTISWSESDPEPSCRTPYDISTLYGSRGDDSMVVNVNGQNHLVMTNGTTFRLRGYRIWEVINNDTNNVMIQPDMNYTLTGDEILSVTPMNTGNGNGKNNWLDLTATGNGVAYLEMSYDAMQVVTGNASGWGGDELAGFVFNACDPARTALVVVQVGNAATDVSFGIRGTSSINGQAVPWDAEFDTLYFVGNSGKLELAPTVSSGSIAKVEVSGDKGASWTALTSADGVYTADIVSGNNIIRVTKSDGTEGYQVVRGDKITVTMTETKGDGDHVPEAGETFRVRLNGVHNPIGKMAGNYNPGYQAGQHVYYKFNGSTVYTTVNYQYDFVSNAWVDVTIPETAKPGDMFTLDNGYIGFNVMGIADFLDSKENHRGITDDGHMTRGAGPSDHNRSILPEITMTVRDSEVEVNNVITLIDAIENATDKATAIQEARAAYTSLSDAQKTQVTNYEKLTAAEKALAGAADAAAAKTVEDLIRQIGEVTLEDETAIEQAREDYTALTQSQKDLVDPDLLLTLENAEAELIVLKDKKAAEDVDALILAIGEVTLEKETQIEAAKNAYADLTDSQEKYVTKLSVLQEADQKLQMLKNTGGVDYGLDPADIIGYVTVSFADNGVRVEGENIAPEYQIPRGVIIPATKVPFKAYDTIASVTLRLLNAKGIVASYQGDEYSGFYLSSVGGFGEFDAGSGSGWMITWNDWFIDKGASEFTVQDGDVIKWQYTCQLGADIGDDQSKAAIEAVEALIREIGGLTQDRQNDIQTAVTEAREAYGKLTPIQQKNVSNYGDLDKAEKFMEALNNTSETDRETAQAVFDQIADLPETVALTDKTAIETARSAYTALTPDQKTLVTNLAVLEAAEAALAVLENPIPSTPDASQIYEATGDYLASLSAPTVGSTNGEWRVIGLKRSGREVPTAYYSNVVSYVRANAKDNRLHTVKSTDNSRVILALTAMGYDVTSVAGTNLLAGLNEMAYVNQQGVNGSIWALIALDSHNYDPTGDVTRAGLINDILAKQKGDGGWATKVDSDPDMTGMALQALAPYYNQRSDVKAAVDTALVWLSANQNDDGSFGTPASSESTTQVIVALSALGIDADTDNRFVKSGVSALGALCAFYLGEGKFSHSAGGPADTMATEQSYYALNAHYRMKNNQKRLYDMTDVTIRVDQYRITENANSTWKRDGGSLTITSNADFEKFVGVKMDSVTVDVQYYTAVSGSTRVTFTADYLKTLTVDTHTVTIVSNDGEASTFLTVALSDADVAKKVDDLISAIGTVTKDSGPKIKEARDEYNALTDAQKALVKNYATLQAAEKRFEEVSSKITVYFTLLGDSNHGDNGSVHTYAGGGLSTWISSKAVMVKKPATVWDVFQEAVTYSYTNSGNYISTINGLSEFSNGIYSGWMYTLNGSYPNLGVEEQPVSDGDVIVFHYTDDYRIERSGFGGGTTTITAQDVIRLIKQIGTVTLEREDAIRKAREAYDSLPEAQKAQVYNYDVLVAAEKRLDELKIQYAIDLINAIGTVTLKSGSKIDDAWNAYNALTVEQKAKVTNSSKLGKAQDTYNALRAEETEKLIDEIDETVTLDSEKAILTARKSYNALTETQRKLVDKEHLDKLKAAELALANLKATDNDKKKAEEVMEQIDNLGTITLDSKEAILAARKAYDKLTDIQKALVTNYEILEAAEKKLEELKRQKTLEDIYTSTGDYLENLGAPSVGSVGGEWMVIGLARSGRTVPGADTYYDRVVQFVRENADDNQRLHFAKSTENSRVILALTALGKDVTNVDGHNLLLGLNDLTYLQKQGINGPIWALIALDSGNYPVPRGNVTREILLETILAAQLGDGGWALSGSYADPDMTGMALQALAPYYKEDAKVKTAVDQALAALSLMQSADGSYSGIDGTSSESIVQVVTALAALGIDADTDARFVKNGTSALDALLTYYVPGGGFRHIPEGNLDGMATEQGYYSLTAYYRMLKNQAALYDMTDVINLGGDAAPAETTASVEIAREEEDKDSGNSAVVWISVTAICSMAAAAVILGRKKLFKF